VRYGDDFILFFDNKNQAVQAQLVVTEWLLKNLYLKIHKSNNVVVKTSSGLRFLGHEIYATSGIIIDKAMRCKLVKNINMKNIGTYRAMHLSKKYAKRISWLLVK